MGNIIIAHLNINSLRNKFDSLVQLIGGSVDILVIGETKLDASFPKKQFMIRVSRNLIEMIVMGMVEEL